MFLKQIDLTTALRPSYLPDEVLLFVQDNVGLYEGKYKLPNQQCGQVYLTTHRICYVDTQEPRKYSVALDLKDVERYEFYAGFLKSSAKVTLIPKPLKRASLQSRAAIAAASSSSLHTSDTSLRSPPPSHSQPSSTATWVCTICSFPNPVPSNFDPTTANAHTPLPPCLACGIKPTLTQVLKSAISNVTSRQSRPGSDSTTSPRSQRTSSIPSRAKSSEGFQCPRCTFSNHPSLLSCEICGAPLLSKDVPGAAAHQLPRTDSPGPMLKVGGITGLDNPESVKISFRNGGEKIFYERLKGAMAQRKWLLHEAPPVPTSSTVNGGDNSGLISRSGSGSGSGRNKVAGIAGLEQMGLDRRKNNELMIGSSFEDLEALMASAKEIIALAESFARQVGGGTDSATTEANALLAESASQLGLVTTKDIVGGGGSSRSESLYLSELSKNLAEFLTDDARGVLKRAGGIMTLVDLWAMFNRARGGVELVSPNDFEKAARLWEKLKLPVRLRTFKSGVMVVQGRDRTDESTIKSLLSWMRDLHEIPPEKDVAWDWQAFGRGVTAQDVAERFGWSIGVAEEELEMAEEKGVLCREEGLEGLKFWENYIDTGEYHGRPQKPTDSDKIIEALSANGLI
ncbi:Vps36-domain-containing protein [Poronia punctata]|nr:Vps36-domain-containing protein [Poronia punctata]